MTTIGTFKKTGDDFIGDIITLNLQSKNVRIVPDMRGISDNAPDYRVLAGRADIGAAWSRTSSEGRAYFSVKLDDPSFPEPVYANLVGGTQEGTFTMIWSRSGRRHGGE